MKRQTPKDPLINEIVKFDPEDVYYAEAIDIQELNQKYGITKKDRTPSLKPLPARWVRLHMYSIDEKDLIKLLKYLKDLSPF
ncbi:MAG: hypothetical protein JEY94_10705 [Melioribacteraceae bacterium]|nr:hypothetical protein [Melioribacteraceae bacterium]